MALNYRANILLGVCEGCSSIGRFGNGVEAFGKKEQIRSRLASLISDERTSGAKSVGILEKLAHSEVGKLETVSTVTETNQTSASA